MADFKDFILKFYSIYHVTQMDSARAERWRDLRGKKETGEWNPKKNEFNWLDDKRSPAMKAWENKLTGDLFTYDDLPDPNKELSDDDWIKFYTTVRTAMRNIDANRSDLLRNADPKILAIDRFFGKKDVQAFSAFEPDPDIVKKPLESLGKILDDPAMANFANWLEASQPGAGYKIFTEKPTLGEFVSALQTGKYDINKGIPTKIRDFLSNILGWLNPSFGSSPISVFPQALQELKKLFGDNGEKIAALQIALDADNEKINAAQLAQFKQPKFYKEILKALYASDKPDKKSPFNSQFANAGGPEITGWMNESVTGSNDYDAALIPKLVDEKNIRETWVDKVGDYKDEHLKRLWDRSSRHVYLESGASAIVGAILKEKISPTDGVLKILEKKDAIKNRVKAKTPSAVKGTEFLFEALEYIKSSGDMDKALEGCLRNGGKAQAVAIEIMKYAIAKGKVNEAKIALETLAVMRYDTFSSAHWAELKKNPIKPFDGASFMKSEPIKFVFDAATKGLNLGLAGVYWTGVISRNIIQHRRAEISKNIINPKNKFTKDEFEIGRLKTALKKINKDNEDFVTLEDAKKESKKTGEELEKYNVENASILELQGKEEELQKNIDDLKRERDINLGHNRLKEFETWLSKITKKLPPQIPTGVQLDPATATPLEIYNEVGIDTMLEIMKHYRSQISGTTPTPGFDIDKWNLDIDNKTKKLKEIVDSNKVNKEVFDKRDMLFGADRAIKSEVTRLTDAESRGLKGETEHKPVFPAKSPLENIQILMVFWNSVNGFTDLSVNSYNPFSNIKDIRNKSDLKNDFERYFAREYS